MLSTLSTLAHTTWSWLPEITVGIQAATALLRFCLTVTVAIQHLRRRRHHYE